MNFSFRSLAVVCALPLSMIAASGAIAGCSSSDPSPVTPHDDGGVDGASPDAASPDGASPDGGSPDGASPHAPAAHRPVARACSMNRPPGNATDAGAEGPIERSNCNSDADCTKGKNGRCIVGGGPALSRLCSYDECAVDADCAAGSVCRCRDDMEVGAALGLTNACVPSDCAVDSDCGAGGYCSPAPDLSACDTSQIGGYYCHTALDECASNSDCGAQKPVCIFDKSAKRWACSRRWEC
jgi:hypothetical protein